MNFAGRDHLYGEGVFLCPGLFDIWIEESRTPVEYSNQKRVIRGPSIRVRGKDSEQRWFELVQWTALNKSFPTESLILAQNERWRRGLGMQVERERGGNPLSKVANW